jgi:hypothetical protein
MAGQTRSQSPAGDFSVIFSRRNSAEKRKIAEAV